MHCANSLSADPPNFGSTGFCWLQWTAFFDGQSHEWRAVVSDVTERHLREISVQCGWQVLEQVHCAVVTADSNGVITSWSRGAERLLGYPASEVTGQPLAFLATPTEKRMLLRRLQQQLGPDSPPINMVVRLRHRYGGSVGVYLVIAAPRAALRGWSVVPTRWPRWEMPNRC